MKKKLLEILETSVKFGLGKADADAVKEMINAGEFTIALEWIIDQLFEFDRSIDNNFFKQFEETAKSMGVDESRIANLKSLVNK
ncbi:MAG TPA: MafI family immunity protein [Chryseosolibacter sp.]|nr:MafI family immunity protein [Chryseosolibacter sp.]